MEVAYESAIFGVYECAYLCDCGHVAGAGTSGWSGPDGRDLGRRHRSEDVDAPPYSLGASRTCKESGVEGTKLGRLWNDPTNIGAESF